MYKNEGIYIDATVGCGGHTIEILKKGGKNVKVLGIDRDLQAIDYLKKEIRDERVKFIHCKFSEMDKVISQERLKEVNGILMDLGPSLKQIKSLDRGFSFYSDKALDMRMDLNERLTAEEIVNCWSKQDIENILKKYGEEIYAKRIAKAICREREKFPIHSARKLAMIVEKVYKKGKRRIHPATKTFQALRIAVNNELSELQAGLYVANKILCKGGRLCVISYHSLEDRIVKRFLIDMEKEKKMKRITRKPIMPSEKEVKENPSSRSAKLRVGEKL